MLLMSKLPRNSNICLLFGMRSSGLIEWIIGGICPSVDDDGKKMITFVMTKQKKKLLDK